MDGHDSKEKSKLTLSLNKDVIQRAKAAGINISEITETMLTAVTMTPTGNSYDDVMKAYMAFFESIKEILGKYNAEVTVLRYGKMNEIVLNGDGLFREIYDDPKEEYSPVREPVKDDWQIVHFLDNPIELLDKVIRALIEAAEENKEQIAKLQFALKFVKALSEEEKGDDKD
jgi:hypothetical protein